jgi:hypothetical protein
MTDSVAAAVRLEMLGTIRDYIRATEAPTWGETAAHVVAEHDVTKAAVNDELRKLEREGFLYRVGDGASAEVKLP